MVGGLRMVNTGAATTGGIIAWRRVSQPGMRAASDGFAAVISVAMVLATSWSMRNASAFDIRTPVSSIGWPMRSTQMVPSALRAISMTSGSSKKRTIGVMASRRASSRRASAWLVMVMERLFPAASGRLGELVVAEQLESEALRAGQPLRDEGQELLVALGGVGLGGAFLRVGDPGACGRTRGAPRAK